MSTPHIVRIALIYSIHTNDLNDYSLNCLVFFTLHALHYRPQRSWAKVIFSQVSVCPQGRRGVCLSACWDIPPLGADPPPPHPQNRPSPGADTPLPEQSPQEETPPPEQTPSPPPGADTTTTPREADCSIRSTSGRYASYWNAFLLRKIFDWDS